MLAAGVIETLVADRVSALRASAQAERRPEPGLLRVRTTLGPALLPSGTRVPRREAALVGVGRR